MRSSRAASRALAAIIGASIAVAVLASCGGDGGGGADTADLTVEQRLGLEAAQHAGCASCHGASFDGGVAPTWRGLAGSEVTLADGSTVVADSAYLTESIADPAAKLVDGYDIVMPRNGLTPDEIARIVTYIEALG
jgi:cytochrome c oxidase subunit II